MGFSKQEYWSGLPFPSPGNLPDLGVEPRSPALQVDSLPSEPLGKPKAPTVCIQMYIIDIYKCVCVYVYNINTWYINVSSQANITLYTLNLYNVVGRLYLNLTFFFFLVLKYKKVDFPGNPVVKNLCFQSKFDWVINMGLIG